MDINNILEIILITYNRKDHLKKTLSEIFADKSPIKNLDITILDNRSDDGTSELIEEYKHQFPNIKHIIHNRNIGGNGNIARAFEIASKKYLWILCDDDFYNWTHWNEIEDGLNQDYDIIMTTRLSKTSKMSLPTIINNLSFVPGGIYKTDNITNDVMQNAMLNIYNSFPHLALVCSIINNDGKIYIPEHIIMSQNMNRTDNSGFQRGFNSDIYYRQLHQHLFVGYINSYQMLKDKKLRYECCEEIWQGKSFLYAIDNFINCGDHYRYNICDIYNGISLRQKLLFLVAIIYNCIFFVIEHYIFKCRIDNEKINFKIFGILKTYIRFKPKQNLSEI